MRAGICFPCGIDEAKLILVAKRVTDGAGVQEQREYSSWQLSQHTCGRKWSLKVSLVFQNQEGLAIRCFLSCSMDRLGQRVVEVPLAWVLHIPSMQSNCF